MKKILQFSLAAALLVPGAAFSAEAGNILPIGTTVPDFTLPSEDNSPISLADYKHRWVVLYCYPKDRTLGCTTEARSFQPYLERYKAANADLIVLSLDSARSHKSLCERENRTFKLLADPEPRVADAFGVPVKSYGTMGFASRQTCLINPEGKIVKF